MLVQSHSSLQYVLYFCRVRQSCIRCISKLWLLFFRRCYFPPVFSHVLCFTITFELNVFCKQKFLKINLTSLKNGINRCPCTENRRGRKFDKESMCNLIPFRYVMTGVFCHPLDRKRQVHTLFIIVPNTYYRPWRENTLFSIISTQLIYQ